MLLVGDGIDVGELTGSLADSADVLGRFHLHHQLVLLHQQHPDGGHDAGEQEGQLIGHVGAGLIVAGGRGGGNDGLDLAQHHAVGEGAGGIQQAVGDGQRQSQPALGVLEVAHFLTGSAQLIILAGFHDAQTDHTHADQSDGAQYQRRIGLAAGDDGQNRHQCAGSVADGGGDAQLNVAKTDIAQRHRQNVQQRHGQVGQNDVPADIHAVEEYLVGGVQTHNDTNGHYHLQVGILVAAVAAADFGEEVRAAPADQGNKGKPKPHHKFSIPFYLYGM